MLICTRGHRPGPTGVALECVQEVSATHVPDLDRLIRTRRCQETPTSAQGHCTRPVGLSNPWDSLEAVSAFYVPPGHQVLLITTEKRLTIRGEREGDDGLGTAVQGVQTLPTAYLP